MRDLKLRLEDILEAIGKIETMAARGRQCFMDDETVQVWMVHHIQVIGEAVRSEAQALKALRPDVPWMQIIAMRHILVHHYFGVEMDDVWNVVERDLPSLRAAVEATLAELESKETEC